MIRGGALPEVALGKTLAPIKRFTISGRALRGPNASQPKVNSALSEETILLNVVTNVDGTVTYHFGLEGEHVATITPTPSPEIALPEATPGLSNGHALVSNGTTTPAHAVANGSGVAHHVEPAPLPALSTAEAAEKLEELLHLDPPARAHMPASTSVPATSRTQNGQEHKQQPKEQRGTKRTKAQPQHAKTVVLDLEAVDFAAESSYNLISVYSDLCDACRLDEALKLIKGCIGAKRNDVLIKLKHYKFLRPASRLRLVSKALRFVQLLPRQFADARTYNMLLTVCAEAGDLRNAMHTVDMLRASGLKMDTILYTNLIKVCAAAGDAEQAFKLYDEMVAANVRLEKQVYATLVSACSQQIERLPSSDRRGQLVLLERAFAVVDDMKDRKLTPDAAVWNALVTASGRAGQLQRAFDVLDNMMTTSSKPNSRTYASIVDACARTGDKTLALRVYRRALKDNCVNEIPVYAAAINACLKAKGGSDINGAMSVYADLQRHGVQGDSALYGALIMAAGKAGDLRLTKSLEEEMISDGLKPCDGTDSALLTAHILNDCLPEATAIYKKMRSKNRWPHIHAMNALINANARAFRLGDVVNLVCDMVAGGLAVDGFTFSAILNACQRANESELALDVYRLMKMRGVRVEEVHCMLLLRMCYNRIRQCVDGTGFSYSGPEAMTASHRSQERKKLLAALTPESRKNVVFTETTGDVVWHAQAFGIYRDAVSAGWKPSIRALNMVLMCLRVPWLGSKIKKAAEVEAMLTAGTGLRPVTLSPTEQKIGIEGVYHIQVISICEDAIVTGVLPSFQVDSASPIDLRALPPAVGEVYALTVVSALQRKVDARREIINRCVFLVPRYDGGKVLMPSTVIAGFDEEHQQHGLGIGLPASLYAAANPEVASLIDEFDEEVTEVVDEVFDATLDAPMGDEKTGLGVAGVLRRLQLWAREYSPEGLITLESKEVTRWAKTTSREIEKRSASALGLTGKTAMTPGMSNRGPGIFQQQRNFRLGF